MPNYMTELSPDNNTNVYQVKDKEASPIDLLKDTVGWVGKNLASNVVVTSYTTQYADILLAEADLEPNTSYKLSFDSAVAGYPLQTNDNLLTYTSLLTVAGRNEITITTKADISRNTASQYNSVYNCWRILKCYNALSATANITNVMLRKTSIIDSTYEPYHESVDVVKANRDEVKDVIGWSGKNLIIHPYQDGILTNNGVTFTPQTDGSLKVTGTASANTRYTFNAMKLTPGKYIISWNNTSGFEFFAECLNNGSYVKGFGNLDSTMHEMVIDVDNVGYDSVSVCLRAKSGNPTSATTIYPMLRKADILDDTYEPYHESVEQCKFDRSEQRVLGAKNLTPLKYNGTRVGVDATVTVNSDMSITLNGSQGNTDGQYYISQRTLYEYKLPKGSYKISGGISGKVYLVFYKNKVTGDASQGADELGMDNGSGLTFTLSELSDIQIVLNIKGNNTFSNLKVEPLVTLESDTDRTYAPPAMTNRELTEELTVQESAVTDIIAGATVYDNTNYLVKYGKVVQMMLQLSNVTTSVAWSQIICKIPNGFRPKRFVREKDSANDTLYNISTNGEVVLESVVSDKNIRISATWITS